VPVLAAAPVTTILMAIIVVPVSLQLGRELTQSNRVVFFMVLAAGHGASTLPGDVEEFTERICWSRKSADGM